MPQFGKLFWLNILCFGIYGFLLLFDFQLRVGTAPLSWFQPALTLYIALPLFGINLTAILEKISRTNFDLLEKLSIASILSLLFPPLLLTLQHTHLHILFPELPIINSLLVFLVAVSIHPLALESTALPSSKVFQTNLFQSWVIVFLLAFGLITTIVYAYYPLPESDPYYWLLKVQSEISSHALASIDSYRPLLSSLSYIFSSTAGLDLYIFFKYLLPFFTLLVLLPAVLIARQFTRRIEQSIILLLPLTSTSFIIYSTLPIPQSLFNVCLTFFLFFVLYAWFSKKDFFYFFSGVIILTAYFYHEIALLIALPWFGVTLLFYRTSLWKFLTTNVLSSILLFFLLLSHTNTLTPLYDFIKNWLVRIFQSTTTLHTNFSFPFSYVNIDGKAVGWSTPLGVVQYYAFYVGPVFFLTVILSLTILKREKIWKILNAIFAYKELFLLSSIFLLFFSIAEILPRFFNIALLPERSWGFAGLFFLALLPIIFRYSPAKRSVILSLLIISFLVNAAAAIYINSTKRYLITSSQIESTHWIKSSLSKESRVLTHGDWSVMKTHTRANFIDVADRNFYSNITAFESILPLLCSVAPEYQIRDSLLLNAQQIEQLSQEPGVSILKNNLRQVITQLQATERTLVDQEDPEQQCIPHNLYIYYAKPSSKNPYHDRPYFSTDTLSSPVFDLYPKRFERIHVIGQDEVIIWKVIQ